MLSFSGTQWAELSEQSLPECSPTCMHKVCQWFQCGILAWRASWCGRGGSIGAFSSKLMSLMSLLPTSWLFAATFSCCAITAWSSVTPSMLVDSSNGFRSSSMDIDHHSSSMTFPAPSNHSSSFAEIVFPAFKSALSCILSNTLLQSFQALLEDVDHWWRWLFTNFSDTFYILSCYIRNFTQCVLI